MKMEVNEMDSPFTRGMFNQTQCLRFMKIIERKYKTSFDKGELETTYEMLSEILADDKEIDELKEEFVNDYGEELEAFYFYTYGLLPYDGSDTAPAYENFIHEGFVYCIMDDIIRKAMKRSLAVLN